MSKAKSMENSDDFSDELDEYEESHDEANLKKKVRGSSSSLLVSVAALTHSLTPSSMQGATSFANKPYDEAYELSQDLSMAESFDGRDKPKPKVSVE